MTVEAMSTYHDVMNMELSVVRGLGGNNCLFTSFFALNPPEPEHCLELERDSCRHVIS